VHAERHILKLTTDADGAATGYTPPVSGRVLEIHYVKPAADGFEDGVGFTITAEATGENLWVESPVNASTVRRPRAPTHASTGTPSLYAALGEPVENAIALANDRVKIVIDTGGDKKSGTFHVVVG